MRRLWLRVGRLLERMHPCGSRRRHAEERRKHNTSFRGKPPTSLMEREAAAFRIANLFDPHEVLAMVVWPPERFAQGDPT